MKLKKLVSALVSCAMVLGTMALPVFADNSTATVKTTEELKTALANPTVTEITIDGTIDTQGVDFSAVDGITIKGNSSGDEDILKFSEAHRTKSITFSDVTLEWPNTNYNGLQHSTKLTYNNCTIKGQPFLYAVDEIFNDCKFIQESSGAYNVWTYGAKNVKFNNCTFNSAGKSVLIYNEGALTTGSVSVEKCKFNASASVEGKAAIEIDSTYSNFSVDIDDQTVAKGFAAGSTSGNTLYNVKKYKVVTGADNSKKLNTEIKVNGEAVMPLSEEKQAEAFKGSVAKVGNKFYTTLADAVAAALNGGTVTLLSDAEGDGVIVPGGSNVTINLNGFTYNVSGATVGSSGTETSGFQLLGNKVNGVYSGENNTKVTIKNGTLKATSESCWILIQNYSDLTLDNVTLDGREIPNGGGGWPYTLSNNYGTTTITGATNIFARSGGTAFDSCKYGSYSIPTVTVETTGTINGNIELTGGNLIVKSGTFTSNVADYVANGYYQKNNNNGTYTVVPADAKVIDTAKTTGATVTLDNLNKNAVVNPAADATYKVVVSTPAAADADAANKAIASNNDTNTSKAMFDISVVKIDSNGTETVLNNVTDQKVTLTLGETPVVNSKVFVYHVDDSGNATKVAEVTADGTNKVTFTAPSFSTYAVTYTPVAPTEAASKVGVAFSPVSQGSNQYYINLKSLDGKPINRFMSTDLVFKNGCATVDYDITPAANMTASVVSENGASREYRFNMDGKTLSSATGTGITIGTITFYGYGTLDFSVDTLYSSGHAINIVNTAKIANNIVDNYIATGATDDTLIVNEAVNGTDYDNYIADDEYGVIKNVTLAPETKDLTVNIAYNNKINNNAAAYQDMTVTISGGDLTTPIVKHLGSEGYTLTDNVYTVTVANELTQNVAYTVTVEGAGYRTARYTVNMATDKTLNFWNNVKDADEVIEVGKDSSKTTKNFLAGDIVKDNNINIYDLSAVVSYFGEGSTDVNSDKHLATANPGYAKYDLNRDGVIDSKDVAYVLVSWGK